MISFSWCHNCTLPLIDDLWKMLLFYFCIWILEVEQEKRILRVPSFPPFNFHNFWLAQSFLPDHTLYQPICTNHVVKVSNMWRSLSYRYTCTYISTMYRRSFRYLPSRFFSFLSFFLPFILSFFLYGIQIN